MPTVPVSPIATWRYVWASPASLVGLVLLGAGMRRARVAVVDGVIEAHGPRLAWGLTHLTLIRGGAAAITLGHVVLGRDAHALASTRTHERVHVRQYERWGPGFLPAYAIGCLVALVRGGHFYRDNPFEVEALAAERQTD